MIAKSASKIMTKFERRSDAEGRRRDRVGDVQQCGDDARNHDEVRERETHHCEQQRWNDEGVDHPPGSRMDRGNDEEPELLQQNRQADDDSADDRELELGEDDVRRPERVQLDAAKVRPPSSSG